MVRRRYYPDLKARIDARDHLEHFEERLPGGKKHQKLADPRDLLNMVGTHMSYGGTRVDVGPESMTLLTSFVAEFSLALLYDAAEALASQNAPALERQIRSAWTELRIRGEARRARLPAPARRR
jgi:hypothetical protein